MIHDVGEAEVGDIIISDGKDILYDPKLKSEKESIAFKKIFSLINRKEYLELYNEYEESLDLSLESFFVNTRDVISNGYIKSILDYIESLRNIKKAD